MSQNEDFGTFRGEDNLEIRFFKPDLMIPDPAFILFFDKHSCKLWNSKSVHKQIAFA